MEKGRWPIGSVWIAVALLLYFFESSAGTRVVLAVSVIVPFFLLARKTIRFYKSRRNKDGSGSTETKAPEETKKRIILSNDGVKYSDSHAGNDPTETSGIREYVPGDSIKNIHWKLSEKLGKTLVREYEPHLPDESKAPDKIVAEDRKTRGVHDSWLTDTRIGALTERIMRLAVPAAIVLFLLHLAGSALKTVTETASSIFGPSYAPKIAPGLSYLWRVPQNGFLIYVRALMLRSEELNRYVYMKPEVKQLSVPNVWCLAVFICLLTVVLVLWYSLFKRKNFIGVVGRVLPVIGIAAVQIYFGIKGIGVVVALFYLLNAAYAILPFLKWGQKYLLDYKSLGAALAVTCIAVLSLNSIFLPAEVRIESASEHVRDLLEPMEQQLDEEDASKWDEAYFGTRHESTYKGESIVDSVDDLGNMRELNEQEHEENKISMPEFERTDFSLKGILMFIAMLAAIIVPFAPFYLLERKKNEIRDRREAFSNEDSLKAVRAMFPHVMDCVAGVCEKQDCSYDALIEGVGEKDFAANLSEAKQIWLEAEYSNHGISDVQRALVEEVMEEAESAVSEKLGYFKRMKYWIVE